eukprot:1978014-Pleurochrysis_carterae.AAC.3
MHAKNLRFALAFCTLRHTSVSSHAARSNLASCCLMHWHAGEVESGRAAQEFCLPESCVGCKSDEGA